MSLHLHRSAGAACTRQAAGPHVCGAIGSGRGGYGDTGGGRGGFGDSGLILGPGAGRGRGGRGGDQGGPARLIIPGQPGTRAPPRPQQLVVDDSGGEDLRPVPSGHQFRPPAGFMNDTPLDDAAANMDPDVMISRLRSRAGQWHQLAKLLPALYSKGYESGTIDEMTGVNPVEQNRWVVAGTVYDSIAATGHLSEQYMQQFDQGGEVRLYHFRFLPTVRRAEAAKYILDQGLDEQQCEVLARAMKEWDRRPSERQGFNDGPGDCLAFKFLRDAIECRMPADAASKLATAFDVVESESGRARLVAWQREAFESEETGMSATNMLNVLRLTVDELGFRPLPQATRYEAVSVQELLSAPRTTQEGAFGSFSFIGDNAQQFAWVALPQWKALSLSRHPVALPVADCAACSDIVAACKAKTDEDRRRMQGPGMLVVDIAPSTADLDPAAWYLVQSSTGGVQLAEGSWLLTPDWQGVKPVALVLFLARPPVREATVTTSELLQI